ncbi:TRIC cation channel family protein [Candidatus Accumulibacter sp. ACC003]|uniref:trimeric intracellular cation channel family protein n=1 Tax=Candidatus Accumulibacter sp. ACC003 TaxID=2823334 RepID=UPI0025C2CCB5|nr:TRIC cation channel family protein [Candidatus Accumulibacter sp. ACC003]
MESLNYSISMAGTAAFAITAVLAVAPRGIDLFGVCVLGIVTAIGGGTLRDVILNVPVFWAADMNYIWVALAASVAAFLAQSLFTRKEMFALLLYIDGLAGALFAIQAADKVLALQFGLPLAPILLAIITAIGGGLIRDVLAGRQNLLMSREIYAVPVLFGSTLFVVAMAYIPQHRSLAGISCVLAIFAFRAAAIHWHWCIPDCLSTGPKTD